jgi:hypothetical protein
MMTNSWKQQQGGTRRPMKWGTHKVHTQTLNTHHVTLTTHPQGTTTTTTTTTTTDGARTEHCTSAGCIMRFVNFVDDEMHKADDTSCRVENICYSSISLLSDS